MKKCTVAANADGEEEGKEEGSSTEDLAPGDEQVPTLQVTLPVAPKF